MQIDELEDLACQKIDALEGSIKKRIDQFWADHFDMNSDTKPEDKGRLHCWVRRKNYSFEIWWTTFRFQKLKTGQTTRLETYVPKGRRKHYLPMTLTSLAKNEQESKLVLEAEKDFACFRQQAAELCKIMQSIRKLKALTHEETSNE